MVDQRQLWPLPIDWKRGGLIQSFEFKTEIFPAEDETEYRRSARNQPRVAYEYGASAHGAVAQATARVLDTLVDETLIFPCPVFQTKLAAPLIGPASTFTATVVPEWLAEGAYVVLVWQGVRYLAQVTVVAGSNVTIDAGPTVTFPVGTKVFLGVQSKINPATRLTFLTTTKVTGKVNLDDVVGLNYVPGDGTPFGLFNGKEVLLKKPNWASPVERTIDARNRTVDFGHGRREYSNVLDFVPHIIKADYLGLSWVATIEFLQFFLRQRGRRGEFYMPSPIADLPLAADLTAGQSFFLASGTEFTDYNGNPAQRNVVVVLKDGTRLFRRVSEVTVSGSNSRFATTEPWASGIARSNIAYVGWLNTYRFAVDELALEWLTDSVAQFSTSFQVLRDLDEGL